MTLTVVHVLSTRHAVGVLAGTGLPADPKLEALVGKENLVLHLRSGDTTMVELPVPVADLGIATVPAPHPGQVDPLAYGLDSMGKALSTLTRWPADSPVSLTADTATVKVRTPPVAAAAVVLVLVNGGGADNGGTALTGTLGANSESVALPITPPLDPGWYGYLLLLAGWVGRTGTSEVPQ